MTTTPKRYEEMAKQLTLSLPYDHVTKDTVWREGGPFQALISEALRTAAREAQVRVLEAAQDMLIFENRAFRALVTLKERIDSGEDL